MAVTSPYSDFRLALTTALVASFPAYSFLPGDPGDSTIPDSSANGYVWVTHIEQDQDNRLEEKVTGMVRMCPVYTQRIEPSIPIDPTPFEALAHDIQVSLSPGQAPGDPWFFEITDIRIDLQQQCVEARVEAMRWNAFSQMFEASP